MNKKTSIMAFGLLLLATSAQAAVPFRTSAQILSTIAASIASVVAAKESKDKSESKGKDTDRSRGVGEYGRFYSNMR
jgi:hypothetical protein